MDRIVDVGIQQIKSGFINAQPGHLADHDRSRAPGPQHLGEAPAPRSSGAIPAG